MTGPAKVATKRGHTTGEARGAADETGEALRAALACTNDKSYDRSSEAIPDVPDSYRIIMSRPGSANNTFAELSERIRLSMLNPSDAQNRFANYSANNCNEEIRNMQMHVENNVAEMRHYGSEAYQHFRMN